MKIAINEVQQWEHTACLRLHPEHELICSSAPLDTHTAADADVPSTFIRSRLDADVLERFPKLQLVATRSTGYDHIDLGYCAAHGITVSNVPDYGDSTVAEHVFALILGLARHLVDAAERTRRGGFSQAGLRGFELRGKTLEFSDALSDMDAWVVTATKANQPRLHRWAGTIVTGLVTPGRRREAAAIETVRPRGGGRGSG
ncbi:hypothetical protein [Nocardia sp. CY41]|uniref:hypothetical protein n=1 Tax=Nocardia sp. CY41 TaxID=2608686 RepID=UPI00135B5D39|nr:hypothetical protein [Nocardia sp. CY41]